MPNSKLAIYGGKKVRYTKMPARHALGNNEIKLIKKAINYYKSIDEDPPYQGKFEDELCKKFSIMMGGGYTDAVSSGCAALYVALASLNIKKGSEILLSPVTCSSDLSVLLLQGYKPVLIDSGKLSYNVTFDELKKKITKKTKAAILTHAAGEPIEEISKIVFKIFRK